jgi:hypothetical protein
MIVGALVSGEEPPDPRLILFGRVQIPRRDVQVGVASGVADFSERPSVGLSMTDEPGPTVLDREHTEPFGTENLMRCGTVYGPCGARAGRFRGPRVRVEEWGGGLFTLLNAFDMPRRYVGQRTGVPLSLCQK